MAAFTNRLAKETSPYLLQHAHNPVDWYPWGEEALSEARKQNKPILVSIGYSACHWCHVMEKESFENEKTAALMNQLFVNIKIDREERPDLDHIYMDAVQAMTGSGGWPLNVFLTPEAKPFYGGTYFPPTAAFNRSSWTDVLMGVSQAFNERRHEVDAQAENLTEHLVSANNFGLNAKTSDNTFSIEEMDSAFSSLMQNADKKEGGFGRAPKFPQSFSIQFLLHYYHHTKNPEALQQALLSIDKMIYGGIYDQLGGGFARYSTDAEWLVPHFEKMLYDNALLLSVISEAYQITQNDLYKKTIDQTIQFIRRELQLADGGFFAALDADSEGVEGKYYIWSKQEISDLLSGNAELFCDYFDVTEKGNWEHSNILNVKQDRETFIRERNIKPEEFDAIIKSSIQTLLYKREKRVRPGLDDKILLSWNALMITGLCKAYAATGEAEYLELAKSSISFVMERFWQDGKLFHTYKNGRTAHPAFLDDYAYLIQALIHLQEVSGDQEYLLRARAVVIDVIKRFSEEETGFFFYTSANQNDVIVRKKEVYDGATPSGNSVMAFNLQYLGIVFDEKSWTERAHKITGSLKQVIIKYPGSFGFWATVAQSMARGVPEIALIGENFKNPQLEFLRTFIPFRIFQSCTHTDNQFPLLAGKPYSPESQFYLCQNYSCQKPVYEIDALLRQMNYV